MLAKSIVENNKCITYLKNMVRVSEEKMKKVEQESNEDMILLKINNKRQLGLYEMKMEKLEKKERLDMGLIVDLKKELEIVKGENESVIASLHKGLKDISSYQQMHAQLLASENNVIREGMKEDQANQVVYADYLRKAGNDLRNSFGSLIEELRTLKQDFSEKSRVVTTTMQGIKTVDQHERLVFRQEMDTFKKSLVSVRNLILADHETFQDVVVELKMYIDQLGRNTDSLAQSFEKQVNRFIELNKIGENRLM